MQASYQLNTAQLNIDFIESIKLLFGNKKIDITIRDEIDTKIETPNKDTLEAMREVETHQTHKVTLTQLEEEAKRCLD